MTEQIIEKLKIEINKGLRSEAQVVYLLAGIRKILEQQNSSSEHPYLEFHCNWVLHSVLRGTLAQIIINEFDTEHDKLLAGEELSPNSEVSKISAMEYLRKGLVGFFRGYGIGIFRDPNDWTEFMYLYTRIIEDVPLRIRSDKLSRISEVVVSVKANDEILKPHRFFKVSWDVTDRDGKSGEIFFLHSYEN